MTQNPHSGFCVIIISDHPSEAFPTRTPIRTSEFVPTHHGSSEEIAGIITDKLFSFLTSARIHKTHILGFDDRKFKLSLSQEMVSGGLESLAGIAPADGSQFIRLPETPQSRIIPHPVLTAHLKKSGKLCYTGEDGKSG